MPVYLFCKSCKNTFGMRQKSCPKCGSPVPSQNKVYRVSVTVNGIRATRTVPNSVDTARQVETKIKSELLNNEYFDRRTKAPTLGQVWIKYTDSHELDGKGFVQDANRYNNLLKERFSKKPLDKISPLDVQRLVFDLKKTKSNRGDFYSSKSIRNTVELLGRLFNHAIKTGTYKGDNPVKKASLPKVNN